MRVPAALVAGSIVPLVSFAGPRHSAEDDPFTSIVKRLHFGVALAAFCSGLLSVTYATVAVNSLTESNLTVAQSVVELLVRDYELSWLGCNVCFYLALGGLAATIGLNGYLALGPKILKPTLTILVSTILIMLSIVNGGVDSEGKMATSWGWERHFGASFLTLCVRYIKLFLTAAWTRGAGKLGPAARGAQASLIFPAVGLFCYSWFTLLRQLPSPWSGPFG